MPSCFLFFARWSCFVSVMPSFLFVFVVVRFFYCCSVVGCVSLVGFVSFLFFWFLAVSEGSRAARKIVESGRRNLRQVSSISGHGKPINEGNTVFEFSKSFSLRVLVLSLFLLT